MAISLTAVTRPRSTFQKLGEVCPPVTASPRVSRRITPSLAREGTRGVPTVVTEMEVVGLNRATLMRSDDRQPDAVLVETTGASTGPKMAEEGP